MKKILILISVLFVSCFERNTSRYTISIPDKSGQYRYYYHTDEIEFLDECVMFKPKEDVGKTYSLCSNFTIETNY